MYVTIIVIQHLYEEVPEDADIRPQIRHRDNKAVSRGEKLTGRFQLPIERENHREYGREHHCCPVTSTQYERWQQDDWIKCQLGRDGQNARGDHLAT